MLVLIVIVLFAAVAVAPLVLTLGAAKNSAVTAQARYFEDTEQMIALGRRPLTARDGDLLGTSH